eukprot:4024874-Prymnesium_polylepis.1
MHRRQRWYVRAHSQACPRCVFTEIAHGRREDSNGDRLRIRGSALLVLQIVPRAERVEALGRWNGDASRDNHLTLRHGPRADLFRRPVTDDMEDQGASFAVAFFLQIVALRLVSDG